jgi:outer membrane protein OmpA-like peptidoglycan-associated protein
MTPRCGSQNAGSPPPDFPAGPGRWSPPSVRSGVRRERRNDAESPFWISFADLMTALMVLFLVALSVELNEASRQRALVSRQRDQAVDVKRELETQHGKLEVLYGELERRETERDARRDERNGKIEQILDEIDRSVRKLEGVRFERAPGVIDFGVRALFAHGRHDLTPEQASILRHLALQLIEIKRSEAGGRWLKQIIAEGFADQTGTYLYNLNLSLQRSQRVLCVLLADDWQAPERGARRQVSGWRPETAPIIALNPVNAQDQALIKRLFLVGGHSSNSAKASPDESRRIQLHVEFYQLYEKPEQGDPPEVDTGRCAID